MEAATFYHDPTKSLKFPHSFSTEDAFVGVVLATLLLISLIFIFSMSDLRFWQYSSALKVTAGDEFYRQLLAAKPGDFNAIMIKYGQKRALLDEQDRLNSSSSPQNSKDKRSSGNGSGSGGYHPTGNGSSGMDGSSKKDTAEPAERVKSAKHGLVWKMNTTRFWFTPPPAAMEKEGSIYNRISPEEFGVTTYPNTGERDGEEFENKETIYLTSAVLNRKEAATTATAANKYQQHPQEAKQNDSDNKNEQDMFAKFASTTTPPGEQQQQQREEQQQQISSTTKAEEVTKGGDDNNLQQEQLLFSSAV